MAPANCMDFVVNCILDYAKPTKNGVGYLALYQFCNFARFSGAFGLRGALEGNRSLCKMACPGGRAPQSTFGFTET